MEMNIIIKVHLNKEKLIEHIEMMLKKEELHLNINLLLFL